MKTERQTPVTAERYLLNVWKNSEKQRDNFASECQDDSLRFDKPIRKFQINSFTTVYFTYKNKLLQIKKFGEAKATRGIFGRLLFVSFQQQIAVATVFG